MIAEGRINSDSRRTSTESAAGSRARKGADRAQTSTEGCWICFFFHPPFSPRSSISPLRNLNETTTNSSLVITGSIFPFLSQVLNPKKKGKKKKKYQNSGTVRRRLAVSGVAAADGVYSVPPLIDRSPSCPAWWTLNSPSWTTSEGGK